MFDAAPKTASDPKTTLSIGQAALGKNTQAALGKNPV
jgi:hypothetical protein